MARKILLAACVMAAALALTGCSEWYSGIPEFTLPKPGSSRTAAPYDEPYGVTRPDTSALESEIQEKANGVEEGFLDAKEDCADAQEDIDEADRGTPGSSVPDIDTPEAGTEAKDEGGGMVI